MPTLSRFFAGVVLAGVTSLATLGFAQRAKPPARPPPRPAKVVDAQAPVVDESAAEAAGAKSGASSNGAVPEPPSEIGDGGVRPSPLNPTAQEVATTAADAGAPIDYDRLLADIAALRARVAAVSDNLYRSRVVVSVQLDGDHAKMARVAVSLDDGVVFAAKPGFAAADMTPVYDHAVAPGRHAITVDIDRNDDRDESFRTSQKSRLSIDVPRDHRVAVEVKILDDSTMGRDFSSDKEGRYDLRVRAKVVAKPVGK